MVDISIQDVVKIEYKFNDLWTLYNTGKAAGFVYWMTTLITDADSNVTQIQYEIAEEAEWTRLKNLLEE